MKARCPCPAAKIASIIRQALRDGHVVSIDGLGTFHPSGSGFEFSRESGARLFIAYVQEDAEIVGQLFRALKRAGYCPWMDKESLLPGQNWPRSIERAIETSDFFLPCFSENAVVKRSEFQSELRFALDCAAKLPLDDVFVIPIRLNPCVLPDRIDRTLHHVDLFPDWAAGIDQIRRVVDHEMIRRTECPAA
jgi:hypothetical protein